MAGPADLGKVHTKVVLYDKIPGVIRDLEKLRQTYSLVVGLEMDDTSGMTSYNMDVINVKGQGQKANNTGCMLPTPTYEPLDNFIYEDTNASDLGTDDIFWKVVGNEEPDETDNTYKSGFSDLSASKFRDGVLDKDESVDDHNRQVWTSQIEKVESSPYSEEEYDRQPITYKGEGYAHKRKTESKKEEEKAKTTSSDPDVDTVENNSFINQAESSASTWWAVATSYPFKDGGWPFWLVIRPKSLSVRKDSYPHSLLSIRLRDGSTARPSANPNGSRDVIGDVELIIDNVGSASVHYEIKSLSDSTDGKNTNSRRRDGKKTKSTSVWKMASINLPDLSSMFANKQEMRIGFIQVLGRLCIYLTSGVYDTVTFLGDKDRFLGFNLDTKLLEVFGYGCSASVMACPMTFSKRAWMVMPKMNPEINSGYEFPAVNIGSFRKGDVADGRFISKPVSQAKAQGASGKKRGDGKMYSGTFHYYKEVLLNESKEDDALSREETTELTINTPNPTYGLYNQWGTIHMVRSGKVSGVSDKPFWFVYMETESRDRQQYTPDGKKVGQITVDGKKVDSTVSFDVGHPSLFSILGHKKEDDTDKFDWMNGQIDISDDVVQIEVNSQVDSPRPSAVTRSGTVRVFNNNGDYSEYLAKARGIKIWMKWSTLETVSFGDDDIVFSGVAFGRSSSQAPGEEYINFECADHWTVLSGVPIKNSPFYDGFYLGSVLEDLCAKAGVKFTDDINKDFAARGGPGYYYLGQGMAVDKPLFRFSSEKTITDCVSETIKNYEVMTYFDNDGQMHMSVVPGGFLFNEEVAGWDSTVYETYYIDIDECPAPHNLILDSLELNSTLSSSIYNSFLVMSADRSTGGLLMATGSRKSSLTSPNEIGYLGFVKEIRLQRPDLGTQESTEWFLETVKKMYSKPGFEVDFTTVGHVPSYRPGQFIRLKDSRLDEDIDEFSEKKFRVTKTSHSYNASDNKWTTKVGAYQVEPASKSFKPSEGNSRSTPSGG